MLFTVGFITEAVTALAEDVKRLEREISDHEFEKDSKENQG
jgi:hypothetical protein